MPEIYRYYIGYSRTGGTANGQIEIGGIPVHRKFPIRSLDDVREVQSLFRDYFNDPSLMVQAFSRFDD